MPTYKQMRSPTRPQQGFTLLEVLVALLLIAMWMLSTAGLQASSLKLMKASEFRAQAVQLASDLAERMEANPIGANAGNYVFSGTVSAVTNCATAACTPAQLAAFDLREWQGAVSAALPTATPTVTSSAAGNPITYTITISWTDRRGSEQYATTGTTEQFTYTSARTIYSPPTT